MLKNNVVAHFTLLQAILEGVSKEEEREEKKEPSHAPQGYLIGIFDKSLEIKLGSRVGLCCEYFFRVPMMKRFFVLALCACSLLCAEEWKNEVVQIDKAVEKLSDLRDLELAKAARYQDQGDRIQFNSNDLIDARRYWAQADASREIAARYQQEIDKLKARRVDLYKQHGERPNDTAAY